MTNPPNLKHSTAYGTVVLDVHLTPLIPTYIPQCYLGFTG